MTQSVKTKIAVTADHIKRGVAREYCGCPIALAINEKIEKSGYIAIVANRVRFKHTIIHDKEILFSETIPRVASDFIGNFDSGRPVEPFEFEVDLPEEFLNGTTTHTKND